MEEKNITSTIKYIGVNDYDLDLFEGQYIVENGMAYNSYLIMDKHIVNVKIKTVLPQFI